MARSYKISAKVETSKLARRIALLQKVTGKTREEILRTATRFFGQSVVKLTKQTKDKKRPIIKLGRGRKKPRYKVPHHGYTHKGEWFTGSIREANKLAVIEYRGLGKYGWKVAVEAALGEPLTTSQKFGKGVFRLQSSAGAGKIRGISTSKSFVDLVNSTMYISRFGFVQAKQALRKTNSRLKAMARNILNKKLRGV